jgi:hypothetical protein
MPWGTGSLALRAPIAFGEALGEMSIYPLLDDQLLILFSSVASPTGQWICTMAAVGHLRPGPVVEMRALDESNRRFVFRPAAAGRWAMDAPEPSKYHHCGAWGSVTDTYDVQVIREGPDRRDPTS